MLWKLPGKMATKRVQMTVRGRVQGVFFRASAQREARRLGLTGWVRNRADGSLEIVAEGEEAALRDLGDDEFADVRLHVEGRQVDRPRQAKPQGPKSSDPPSPVSHVVPARASTSPI